MRLYHRTRIAEAVEIGRRGFQDDRWSFAVRDGEGLEVKLTGVWLTDRPLSESEGPPGDALVEVEVDLGEDTLSAFELEGVFWDVRLFVVPAEVLNSHTRTRIVEVDPRTSWFHDVRKITE
ncbi:MAG TPA: hypothetical protein VGA02_10735 [Gemmatimonadales bacterium]